MINLKPSKFWYILLTINILYVRNTTCSITSYIGSFFGLGGKETTTSTTTTQLPPTLMKLPSNIKSSDHLQKHSVQYVPVVYYIPTGNSNKQNSVASLKDLSNIPNYGTVNNINPNQYPYYPWYHIRNPVNIPSINNLAHSNNQPIKFINNNNVESANVFKSPNKEIDELPRELQDLAKKLGYNDTNSLPSLSQLREYLELSTDQETIDFILDLASTDYGLNLIKSYIIEEFTGNDLNNNEENYIDDYNYNNFESAESNIMSIGHPDSIHNFNNKLGKNEGTNLEEKYVESSRSTTKVRRENNPEDATKILDKNDVHATIKRGRVNLEILKKLITHPFQTGFFGTLKHWTGFFIKNEELENSDVPTVYGPKNKNDVQPEIVYSFVDQNNNPIKTFTDANGSPAHYVQYPDGKIYIINSDLINYYNNNQMSNDHKNYDESVAKSIENIIITKENPDSLHISNKKSTKTKYLDNNNKDIFRKTMKNEKGNTPTKIDFLENSFRNGFDDYPEPDLEVNSSSSQENINAHITSSIKVVEPKDVKFTTEATTSTFAMVNSTESHIKTTTVYKKIDIENLETTTEFYQQNVADNTHNDEHSFKINSQFTEKKNENEKYSTSPSHIPQSSENQKKKHSSTTPYKIQSLKKEIKDDKYSSKTITQKSELLKKENQEIDDQEPAESIIQHVVVKPSDEQFVDKFKSLDEEDVELDVNITVEPDLGSTDEPDVSIADGSDVGITDEPDVDVRDEPDITTLTTEIITEMKKTESKQSDTPSLTTVKTTVLKRISNKDEWKPQRVSGINSFATGRIYRANPLEIVVPKMIVPAK